MYKDLYHESAYLEGRIRNVSTKQCISLFGGALAMGSCIDSASFVRIVAIGEANPVYRLELGFQVLDAPNQSTQAGLAMGIWTWNGGKNQEFRLEGSPVAGVEANRIKMVHSDLYLHPAGASLVQDAAAIGADFNWEQIKGSVPFTTTIGGRAVPPPAVLRSDRSRVDALGRRFPGSRNTIPFAPFGTLPSP